MAKDEVVTIENGHVLINQTCDQCNEPFTVHLPKDDYNPEKGLETSTCLDCLMVSLSEKQQGIIETQRDVIMHQHSEIVRLESFIFAQDKQIEGLLTK